MPKKLSQEEFLEKVKKIHKDKLIFDESVYNGMNSEIVVKCPIHGYFSTTPSHLIHHKNGCKYCAHQSYVSNKEEFEKKANNIHKNKYLYDKVKYVNNKTNVIVTCKIHGDFNVRPDNHIHGSGCPKCGKLAMANKQKHSKNKFIELSKKIHGNKYDYSKVEYIKYGEKVCIICPKHGEFWQTPDNHIHSHGCPLCNESKLEKEICNLLTENKIQFIRQKTFPWLKHNGNLFLDFYLPNYNTAIECQGIQHFKPIEHFGGEKEYQNIIARDKVKFNLCKNNNIKIIYFSNIKKENVINNDEEILKEIKK